VKAWQCCTLRHTSSCWYWVGTVRTLLRCFRTLIWVLLYEELLLGSLSLQHWLHQLQYGYRIVRTLTDCYCCVPLLLMRNNCNHTTAFNSEVEDMLCYSGTGTLCIKTGSDFPLHQQKLSGDIVGFSASKVRVTPLLPPLEHWELLQFYSGCERGYWSRWASRCSTAGTYCVVYALSVQATASTHVYNHCAYTACNHCVHYIVCNLSNKQRILHTTCTATATSINNSYSITFIVSNCRHA
jgi:hypothetical protein